MKIKKNKFGFTFMEFIIVTTVLSFVLIVLIYILQNSDDVSNTNNKESYCVDNIKDISGEDIYINNGVICDKI